MQFLCHGWEDYHQIRYAGAEWHPVVESVTKIIIFVKQDGGGRHLGFWKNSHDFAQDWLIWLKFCMSVQNSTINWIVWLKMPSIQNGGGRQVGFHKSDISTSWMGGFLSYLVGWWRMTTCSRKHDQNYHIWRNKMAAGAILDFWKITITLRRIQGFGSNFVYWYKMTHKIRSRDQKNSISLNFYAILDLDQRLLRRLGWTYFAKIMQQMYNTLRGNKSCDQEFKMAADCLSLFVRHLLMLENFNNFEKFETLIYNSSSEITHILILTT